MTGADVESRSERTSEPGVAVVTGASGFAAQHLVGALLDHTTWDVVGLSRRRIEVESQRYTPVVADVCNPNDLRSTMAEAAPDFVFHLAAATPPAAPDSFFSVNVGGTATLLEAVVTACPTAAVLVVGSDAQYGPQDPSNTPTSESAPMRPMGPYGRSKVLQEAIGLAAGRMTDMRVVCVRPFNHIGPGQSDRFVVSSIARQVAEAEAGLAPPEVTLGRVDSRRDFTDVRDTVRAYIQALVTGRNGSVYNIGSGVARTIEEVVSALTSQATIPVTWRSVRNRIAPTEVTLTMCDAGRLTSETGWEPRIPLEKTLMDTLSYWRQMVGREERDDIA